jgi:hypothetical protein
MVQADPRRRRRVEQAIEHAVARRWDLAARENKALLKEDQDDLETANRLGKALTELEDYAGAMDAYGHALRVDPVNAIARKNLERLKGLTADGGSKPAARGKAVRKTAPVTNARARSLVEDSGQSAEFPLLEPNAAALKRITPGDSAVLEPTDSGVRVATARGTDLGTIDRRAALRLKRMIEGGNKYTVIIRHVEDGKGSVHIRETRTDPSLAGQASFIAPAKKKRAQPRAYTRSSVVKHDREVPDPEDDEHDEHDSQDGVAPGGRDGDEADEMEARGFTERRTDDDSDDSDGLDDELDEFDDKEDDEGARPEEADNEDDELDQELD